MSDNSTFNSFSTNSGSSDSSNGLVSKLAFLLLVIVGFMLVLRVGLSVMSWLFKPDESPHLIDGMVDATQMVIFTQDPSSNSSKTIYRSVNATDGIEFTWSVWIYINNLQYLEGQYRHVFYKGNSDLNENGLNFPNNAPGLYIAPNTNALIVMMNTYNSINEEVMIPDIPLNKWVNVIIRCQNTTMDVYINGTITRSVNLMGVPKQNYGDVYVGMNGGFDGNISNLWYYNYALGTSEIQRVSSLGPNTKMIGANGMSLRKPDYLSLRWYFYGSGDMFNPDVPSAASLGVSKPSGNSNSGGPGSGK